MSVKTLTNQELAEMMDFDGPSAITVRLKLQPAVGQGGKFNPSTYKSEKGPGYAMLNLYNREGKLLPGVIVDSEASQANRFEKVLKMALDSKELDIPNLTIDLSDIPELDTPTRSVLELSHRIADAELLNSECNGMTFRNHPIGRAFEQASIRDASNLYKYCVSALLLGVWDSTRFYGMGAKFPRCVTSEIVGIDVIQGKTVGGKVCDIPVSSSVKIYEKKNFENGSPWTINPEAAFMEKNGKKENPKKWGKDGKPSNLNLGNIPPTIQDGGFTADYLKLDTTITITGIKNIQFGSPEKNKAGHAVLAALALCAITRQYAWGYDLRSGCCLVTEDPLIFEAAKNGTPRKQFQITYKQADQLFVSAVESAESLGLVMEKNENLPVFKPTSELKSLYRESMIIQGFIKE